MSGLLRYCRTLIASAVALGCCSHLAVGQDKSDASLASVAAAKTAPSIVAIARVRLDESGPPIFERERFPPEDYRAGPGPADPDFFPHEFGAGVVIDRGGLILTSLHVLGEISHSRYFVWAQRRGFSATVKAADPWLDVAVLEVSADDLPPIELGDAREAKVGDRTVALIDPLSIARDGEPTIIEGRIAQIGCEAPTYQRAVARNGLEQLVTGRDTLHHYGTMLRFETASPVLCSGGALVNEQGKLIGLLTTYNASGGLEGASSLAIPIDGAFQHSLEILKRGALPEYGLLGVALPMNDHRAQPPKVGAVVDDVMPGSPGAKAGLKAGDLITQVGDQKVENDLQLIRIVSALPAQSQVVLQIIREPRSKKPFQVAATLSKKYQESAREPYAEVREPVWRGMRVDYATASPMFRDLARQVDPEGCVAVIDVDRDSPAWKAGMRNGVFISHVGKQRVSTPQEFRAAVEQQSDEVALRITTAGDGDPVRRVAAP
jgi:serine protease Do